MLALHSQHVILTPMKLQAAFLFAAVAFTSVAFAQDGAALFNEMCAGCHSGQVDRAPNREALRSMPAERILNALERGLMVSVTTRRTSADC